MQKEHFLHRLKLYPQGFSKEIHSIVGDGTDRKQVNAYKTKPTNTKCLRNKCIILSHTIQKDLKIDIANHVAYAAYATT